MLPQKLKNLIFFIAVILLLSFGIWSDCQNKPQPDLAKEILKVIFLDVGQGDSALIITSNQQNILIDGGPDNTLIYKLGKYLPFYDHTIDLMILTHPDADHLNGLIDVTEKYEIKKILATGVIHTSANYVHWLKIIEQNKIPVQIAQAGEKIIFPPNLDLEIFYPLLNFSQKETTDTNLTSIVLKLSYFKNTFLFTGDAPIKAEKEILAKNFNLKSDVLKISHHGSKTATSAEFLSSVNPTYAVISVGKNNNFGHPNLRVLNLLKRKNIEILRTDELGDIIFESNGQDLKIK